MNILRGVLPCFMLLLFALGMFLLRSLAFLWIFILAAYLLLSAGGRPRIRIARAIFDMFFLPYTAYYHADAAIRALWRTYVNGKNMLEWVVSNDADKSVKNTPSYYCGKMSVLCRRCAFCTFFIWNTEHNVADSSICSISYITSKGSNGPHC